MIPWTEYVPPEPREREPVVMVNGTMKEWVDVRGAGLETRTRWITQTANQAVGTGVLADDYYWLYVAPCPWPGCNRGYYTRQAGARICLGSRADAVGGAL